MLYCILLLGEEYDHNPHRLPLGVMKAIRPVFDELAHGEIFEKLNINLAFFCSGDTLQKVINGGSQNANESFHSVLWNLAPKNQYATGVIIDLCIAIAVLSYNEGHQSLLPVIAELTGKNIYKFGVNKVLSLFQVVVLDIILEL